MANLKPFQLLETNIISAQDLQPVSRKMRTYATAWIQPKRKLSTSVDTLGHNNPTWNDKFVFRVDEEFLRDDTSAVMIEIYASHWFRDTLVGTVRVLVGNFIPPHVRSQHHHHHHKNYNLGMRFAALQVRRLSGRPQGLINIGVSVLDSSMRSMPLYSQISASAVGYRDLMDDDYIYRHHSNNNLPNVKPILLRSRSERSDRVAFDDLSTTNGSIVGAPQKKGPPGKASSLISVSESTNVPKGNSKTGKASSVISGAEHREKPKEKGKKAKASSVIGSILGKESTHKQNVKREKPDPPKTDKVPDDPTTNKKAQGKSTNAKENGLGVGAPTKEAPVSTIGKPITKSNGFDKGGPKGSSLVNAKYVYGGPAIAHSFWSDSEVGPSPSEVAAAVAKERYPLDDNQSSVLDGWSLDESVEGLRSKLERWRTELPPLYDRGYGGSNSYRSTSQHIRRQTDNGGGLLSCFGNICGYECQCVCGKPPEGRKSLSQFQSPSASAGRSFV